MGLGIKRFLKNNAPFKGISETVADRVTDLLIQSQTNRLLRERGPISLEVGAGNKKGSNGWVTIDISKTCDLRWDLRRGIPFPDESLAKVYSSHFLEHLSFEEGQKFLDECLRVLIPGGIISICVPNAKLYIDAYLNSKDLDRKYFFDYTRAYNNTSRIDFVNYIAYMAGEHKYMFDQENLVNILTLKGFRNARNRSFEPSLDLKEREFESIYAEAEK